MGEIKKKLEGPDMLILKLRETGFCKVRLFEMILSKV